MEQFKIYNMGGSCCSHHVDTAEGREVFIKEISKDIKGVDNGFKKFYYEIDHMKNYQYTNLFPEIYFIKDDGNMYSVGMEYCYKGATLSDLIRNKCVDITYFYNSFDYIMDCLFDKLYSRRFLEEPPIDYLDICYFERVKGRLKHIEADNLTKKYHFSSSLMKMIKNGCIINGEYYPPILEYIAYMQNNQALRERLNIHYTCQAHYDLCPLNIVVDADFSKPRISNFKLIDVRGEGETGRDKRHFMYDMGKMLLGLDAFDLFRIFNGSFGEESYMFKIDNGEKIPVIDFRFKEKTIAERYKLSYQHFWKSMENKEYYLNITGESKEDLKLKFLFSQCMMYHPDVPCRIIYEKNEELALLIYMRGMLTIRYFLEEVYGKDPVGKFDKKVNLWEGL